MKNLINKIDWEKVNGLLPAVIQDSLTGAVLMLGYMNKEALVKTLATEQLWFYSRTKKRLWLKGETSGNFLNLVAMGLDCDRDTLLVKVFPQGPTCHKLTKSCFHNGIQPNILFELYKLIVDRKLEMPEKSYTSSLFRDGLDRICEKIYEESDEFVKAAKYESDQRLIEESTDLLYHFFVLLVQKKVDFKLILEEILKRSQK